MTSFKTRQRICFEMRRFEQFSIASVVMVYCLRGRTDRIELYTESFAEQYPKNPDKAIAPFVAAAQKAQQVGLGLNAGHDLSLENIQFFAQNIPGLLEVSIGHALVCESLYYGLENVINQYIAKLSSH